MTAATAMGMLNHMRWVGDTITFPNESIHINRSRVPEMCSCVYVGSAGVNMQGSANCVVHE